MTERFSNSPIHPRTRPPPGISMSNSFLLPFSTVDSAAAHVDPLTYISTCLDFMYAPYLMPKLRLNAVVWLWYNGTLMRDMRIRVPCHGCGLGLSLMGNLLHDADCSFSHASSSYEAEYCTPESGRAEVISNAFPSAEQALFRPRPNLPKPLPSFAVLAIVSPSHSSSNPIPEPSSVIAIVLPSKSSVTSTLTESPILASIALSTSSETACSVLYPVFPSFWKRLLSGVMSAVFVIIACEIPRDFTIYDFAVKQHVDCEYGTGMVTGVEIWVLS